MSGTKNIFTYHFTHESIFETFVKLKLLHKVVKQKNNYVWQRFKSFCKNGFAN